MSSAAVSAHPNNLSTLDWRQLGPADLGAMESLHHHSIAGMPAQLVKPESHEFLASLLLGRGQVIGALAGPQLVAYGVLQHDLLPEDNPRPHLGLAPDRFVAKLAGAAVAPSWRGQGLQRSLIARRMARADGSAVLFATASPGNHPSWRSLLACGFAVRALEYRYGGLPRYLLAYDPAAPAPAHDGASAQDIDSSALAHQRFLLNAGWQGVAPGTALETLRLVPPRGELT